jgi:hypothetical protein
MTEDRPYREAREARRAARDAARAAREEARRKRDEARSRARGEHGDRHSLGHPEGTKAEATFEPGEIAKVRIEHTAGRLVLRNCAEGEAPGVVSYGSKAAPELRIRQENGELHIAVKLSLGRLFRRRQGADTEIRLPKSVESLRLDQGAGRIQVLGLDTREMRMDIGAGDVNVRECSGALRIEIGAGKAAIHGHRGTTHLETGTGDVLVEIAEAPAGDYHIGIGMGSAEMRLPPGLTVGARLTSGIGKAMAEYPLAGDDAPIQVRMNTGIGRAVLRALDSSAAARTEPTQRAGSRAGRGTRASAQRAGEAEEMRVLQMLEQGRLTPREAANLIAALKGLPPPDEDDDEI